jgi:acetyl-CoA synthetase
LQELKQEVRKHIGGFALPQQIVVTSMLPKTRSGKIMRRILRKIAVGELSSLGDISTLADPEAVQLLIEKVKDIKQ